MTAAGVLCRWNVRAVLRDRWFAATAAAFAVLAVAASAVALAGAGIVGVSSFDRAAAALVQLTMLFVPLIGLTVGAGWIAADRESGALALLLAQPVDRRAVFTGQFAGVATAIAAAILVGYGAAGALLAVRAGTEHLGSFVWMVALAVLLAVAMLAIGFAISAVAPNRSHALGVAVLWWLVLVVVSDLGVLGTAAMLRLPAPALMALVSVNPVSAFRIGAIVAVGSTETIGPVGIYVAERLGTVGLSGGLVAVLVAWALGAFWVGRTRFARAPVDG
ncbi:MAG: ABC transporter permease [Armatimonadota bacterium]|nr:ABC transporter permease [Armatimonadota bacterium]MDR5697867.1 ABC transporter permease [Armatimonadota bacterium]